MSLKIYCVPMSLEFLTFFFYKSKGIYDMIHEFNFLSNYRRMTLRQLLKLIFNGRFMFIRWVWIFREKCSIGIKGYSHKTVNHTKDFSFPKADLSGKPRTPRKRIINIHSDISGYLLYFYLSPKKKIFFKRRKEIRGFFVCFCFCFRKISFNY